jgi:putative phosphoesterase
MKILSISDIHGEKNDNFTEYLKNNQDIDLVLINGDITNFGPLDFVGEFIDSITELGFDVFAVPGNCDPNGICNAITDTDAVCLHNQIIAYGDVIIFGFGGSNPTPFDTPGEFQDQHLYDNLKELFAEYEFMANDKVPDGAHVGSKALRDTIEEFKPDINLCGHIHEAMSKDKVGDTIVVNPGMLKENHACLITIDDDTLNYDVNIVSFLDEE